MRIIEALAVCSYGTSGDDRSGNLLVEFIQLGRSDLAAVEYSSWPWEYKGARTELSRRLEKGRFWLEGYKDGADEAMRAEATRAADAVLDPVTNRATLYGVMWHGVRIVDPSEAAEPEPADEPDTDGSPVSGSASKAAALAELSARAKAVHTKRHVQWCFDEGLSQKECVEKTPEGLRPRAVRNAHCAYAKKHGIKLYTGKEPSGGRRASRAGEAIAPLNCAAELRQES